jgi:hypothetical protein
MKQAKIHRSQVMEITEKSASNIHEHHSTSTKKKEKSNHLGN